VYGSSGLYVGVPTVIGAGGVEAHRRDPLNADKSKRRAFGNSIDAGPVP
jgi:malate/lactate dehydrogenase